MNTMQLDKKTQRILLITLLMTYENADEIDSKLLNQIDFSVIENFQNEVDNFSLNCRSD